MLESVYQGQLIKTTLPLWFPDCVAHKNAGHIQGFPDLTILFRDMWAVLEVKAHKDAPYQPNQEYYLDLLGTMSFAATIYPENEEEVLRALQHAFETRWVTRFS